MRHELEHWVSGAAIREEGSGYFLVASETVPAGCRVATTEEASGNFGRGPSQGADSNQTSNKDYKCPDCPLGASGMPMASVHAMMVSLHIEDTPAGYTPPYGPPVYLTLYNNETETLQPANVDYANFGRQWSFNWSAYVNKDGSSATVKLRYGGAETYSLSGTTPTAPDPKSQARLVEYTTGTTRIERWMPDGSKEVYVPLVTSASTYWLSSVADPQGNAVTLQYSGTTARLDKITDALGQNTTFTYASGTSYAITEVRFPISGTFSPTQASFGYDGQGRLSSLTDAVTMSSTITYSGTTDVISGLITPYGTTSFTRSGSSTDLVRWIETTDPLGGKERVESIDGNGTSPPWVSDSVTWDTVSPVPSGNIAFYNGYMQWRNCFYWNKKQMADMTVSGTTSIDYTKATVYHFLHEPNFAKSSCLESLKPPLDNRLWFNYPGQGNSLFVGTSYAISKVARVTDSGTTQVWETDRNDYGSVTQAVDPLGRTTYYTYETGTTANAPNALLKVQQLVSGGTDTLFTATWNSAYRPLSITNAAGRTTNYTWNSKGQILKIVDALSGTTTFTYSATGTGETYGYLMTIDPALSGTNDGISYTYDSLGRVKTRSRWGYTEQYTYDRLNRLTKTTYPDGTYQQWTYTNLDVTQWRNRLGVTGTLTWDANRHLTASTDQLGRATTYEWCNCGSMTKLTDPLGNETDWKYDLESRPIEKDYADGTKSYTAYNVVGLVSSSTDAKGQAKTYSYALDDRLTALSYSGTVTPEVDYTWDAYYPRITHVDSGSTSYGYTYRTTGTNGAGQVSTINGQWSDDTITYGYDGLGRVNFRKVNTSVNQNSWTYDAIGRVTSATTPLGAFSYTYDGTNGRVSRVDYPNGEHTDYAYYGPTGDLNLQQITQVSGTKVRFQESYTYDAAQQNVVTRVSQTGTSAALTFSYSYFNVTDKLAGVTCVSDPTHYPLSYSYDSANNQTSVVTPSGTQSFVYNNVNERTTHDGSAQTFDANGNLVTSAEFSGTVTWDAADRPIAIDFAGGTKRLEYVYDGLGRRVIIRDVSGTTSIEHRYIWSGDEMAERRLKLSGTDGTTPQTIYCRQGEVKNIGGTYYNYSYVRDWLGSVRMSENDAGGTIEYNSYPPFGVHPTFSFAANGSADADFGYAGYFKDPVTGLWLTKYRVLGYGAWFSRDPIESVTGDIPELLREGPNVLTYCNNNPVNFVDLLGLHGGPGGRNPCHGDGLGYIDLNFDFISSFGIGFNFGFLMGGDGFSMYGGPAYGTPGPGASLMGGDGTLPGAGDSFDQLAAGAFGLGGARGQNSDGSDFSEGGYSTPGFNYTNNTTFFHIGGKK